MMQWENEKRSIAIWLIIFFGVLIWSGINPHDRFTWALEVSPAIMGLVALAVTYQKFRFSNLVYWFVLAHAIILMIGGRYTYAMVPLFDWLKDSFELSRNHYDKVGHFAQGFIPALITREILIRKSPLKGSRWLHFIVVSICLALSALYELVEWWVALATGEGAEAFLGTQGYIWDTQSDMAWALTGAILSLLMLSRYHDKAIEHVVSLDQPRQNHSTGT
jgi:putative membrane protein